MREENEQEAIKASFDLCASLLHDATLHWTTPWAATGFDDCQSEMDPKIGFTPYTWILGFNAADVYSSVSIVVGVGQIGGDDMSVYKDILNNRAPDARHCCHPYRPQTLESVS